MPDVVRQTAAVGAMEWIGAGSLLAWVWLLLGQGFFWRTDVRLPDRRDPERWPTVAVVVPARDEAAVLPDSLPSLLGQKYPGRAEVFLVDDGSTDGTGALARQLAAARGGLPLTVSAPGEPEPGWTGKLWAVRHGIALARERVAPEYLLLTDADIAHDPDSLRELVAAARSAGLDLVSQMARLRAVTFWERLIVPAFVYFFGQLYPFRWVNRPGARTAAAAGGCVLLRREAAERAGIPDAIRHAVIDDVTLARAVKRSGGTIWLGLADRVDSVRPYPRPWPSCGGWSRAAPTPNCGTSPCCCSAPSSVSRWCTWCRPSRWRPDWRTVTRRSPRWAGRPGR